MFALFGLSSPELVKGLTIYPFNNLNITATCAEFIEEIDFNKYVGGTSSIFISKSTTVKLIFESMI